MAFLSYLKAQALTLTLFCFLLFFFSFPLFPFSYSWPNAVFIVLSVFLKVIIHDILIISYSLWRFLQH